MGRCSAEDTGLLLQCTVCTGLLLQCVLYRALFAVCTGLLLRCTVCLQGSYYSVYCTGLLLQCDRALAAVYRALTTMHCVCRGLLLQCHIVVWLVWRNVGTKDSCLRCSSCSFADCFMSTSVSLVLLRCFTFTCPRVCSFQAVSDIERNEWLDAIRMAILKGLDDERHVERGSVPSSHDILDRICQNASNRTCADCNSDSECVGR